MEYLIIHNFTLLLWAHKDNFYFEYQGSQQWLLHHIFFVDVFFDKNFGIASLPECHWFDPHTVDWAEALPYNFLAAGCML
jgi:hypothetical protein